MNLKTLEAQVQLLSGPFTVQLVVGPCAQFACWPILRNKQEIPDHLWAPDPAAAFGLYYLELQRNKTLKP